MGVSAVERLPLMLGTALNCLETLQQAFEVL
jgi:hypothetical protein